MMDSKSSAGEEREVLKVFAYIPNIIGNSIDCKMRWKRLNSTPDYTRLALLFSAFYFSLSDYKLFLYLYVSSFALDVVDGHVARALHQSTYSTNFRLRTLIHLFQASRFGAALDMLADKYVWLNRFHKILTITIKIFNTGLINHPISSLHIMDSHIYNAANPGCG